jgi:putative SOS response-associated peptidase YedK
VGFAGLAETWMGPNGEEVDTVAIITAEASTGMSVLHHRVPVTITPEHFDRWLDCSSDSAADVMTLLAAPADGTFAWHPVSMAVNKVVNDDAQLLLPISAQEAAIEQVKPAKASRKVVALSEDDGQGSLF